MRIFIIVLSLMATVPAFAGDTYVNGYYRSNGTYVNGYHRNTADDTPNNNYGTAGNQNPYTGNSGARPYYYTKPA